MNDNKEKKGFSASLVRQPSTERHTNERRRELPPVSSSQGNQLG